AARRGGGSWRARRRGTARGGSTGRNARARRRGLARSGSRFGAAPWLDSHGGPGFLANDRADPGSIFGPRRPHASCARSRSQAAARPGNGGTHMALPRALREKLQPKRVVHLAVSLGLIWWI